MQFLVPDTSAAWRSRYRAANWNRVTKADVARTLDVVARFENVAPVKPVVSSYRECTSGPLKGVTSIATNVIQREHSSERENVKEHVRFQFARLLYDLGTKLDVFTVTEFAKRRNTQVEIRVSRFFNSDERSRYTSYED